MNDYQHKRPSLPGRDSSGKRVDILNDDVQTTTFHRDGNISTPYNTELRRPAMQSHHSSSSSVSSPTPDLIRSESYDTRDSDSSHRERTCPTTPPTPADDYHHSHESDHGASYLPDHAVHHSYPHQQLFGEYGQFPVSQAGYYPDRIREIYEEEPVTPEKGVKRYPCKFADREGCTKTFTTSGHASRHSKIHTAEKSIVCEFPGCNKKFTRKDNMRQHFETHSKEKERPRKNQASQSPLTRPAGIKKTPRHLSLIDVRPVVTRAGSEDPMVDPQLYGLPPTSAPFQSSRLSSMSPLAGSYSVQVVDRTMERPQLSRAESALDVLADAANYTNSRYR